MKWASVKVPAPMHFVCSQGASRMHGRPSVTPVPFPSLIRNYWVDYFSSILDFINNKKRPHCLFPLVHHHTSLTDKHLPRPKSSQEMERLTWHEAFHHTISKAVCFTYSNLAKDSFLHIFYVGEYVKCSPLQFHAHSQWSIIVLMTCQDFEVRFSIPLMELFCVCISRLPSETVHFARWECSFGSIYGPLMASLWRFSKPMFRVLICIIVPGGRMAGSALRYQLQPKFSVFRMIHYGGLLGTVINSHQALWCHNENVICPLNKAGLFRMPFH